MRKLFTLVMLCVLSLSVLANKQISGVVVDEANEPVIGASIQVLGTTMGTITDVDGAFELSVPDDATQVKVSAIGYKEQLLEIKKVMHVVMAEATIELQEVISTGYGSVTKGAFGGSAQTVTAETIEKKAPSEITKSMAGEIAGVQVVTTSGQPGSSASIRIRGIGSVNASSAPLIIVDGVTYEGDMSSINPDDIATYDVLKDASATALYGSRGANGVIVINTKKGTAGEEAKIDVDVNYGANLHLLPLYDVIKDPQEYVEMAWMSVYNSLGKYNNTDMKIRDANKQLFGAKGLPVIYNLWDKEGSQLVNGYTGKFRDNVNMLDAYKNMSSWEDNIFRVGQKAQANLSFSGGTPGAQYYASFGYLKDEGYYIGSDFDRFTARSKVNFDAKKWLKAEVNLAYTYSSLNNPGQGSNMNNGFAYVNGIPPIYPVFLYNADGTIVHDPKTGNNAYDYGMREGSGRGFGSGINPAGALLYDKQKTIQHQLAASARLEFQLYKGLKFEANVGLQYVGMNSSELTNNYYGDAAGIGRIYKQQYNYLNFEAKQMLNYNNTWDEHDFSAMGVHETHFYTISGMYGQKNRIVDPQSLEWGNAVQNGYMSSATNQTAMESFLLQARYSYDSRYYLTANYRADGSSKFAKGHRWGHFGSISAVWAFTNEAFMQDVEQLKNGKLRFSWGALGNQGIGSDLFQDQYSIDYVDGQYGITWEYKGNPNLTWERTSHYDVGLEFDIDKYLDVQMDYFYKFTDNMLMPQYKPSSLGYSYVYINGGKMSNQGVELQIDAHLVDTRNVKLDFRMNGAWYHNKILELPKFNEEADKQMSTNGGLTVGKSLYDYAITEYVGVDPTTGEALYVGYYDSSKGKFGYRNANLITDEEIETQGAVANYITDVHTYRLENPNAVIDTVHTTNAAYCGYDYLGYSAEPAWQGGFGIGLEVYGVTLDVTCSYGIGGYGYDNTYAMLMGNDKVGNYNWHVDMRNMWTEENTNTNIPRLNNGSDSYTNVASTRFLTSNSFLNLNNVRLGYKFSTKLIEKIKLSRLEIYVQGDNLAVLSARKGYNPMVSYTGSSDSYQYTPLSTVMGGIKLQF
jgi:TonB-linked SusC/RagA family outer membrane protein